ncbi:MAG: Fis family transcriptional regulator [Nitrosomonadales bacterium]|nr:MAG: Fis family transcriptional regulator [Nitrosomonadales bacterium]
MNMTASPLPELPPEMVALLDSLPEPRVFVGRDYRVLAVNQAYREQFGDALPARGRYCYEISHHYDKPCDQAGESCPLKDCQETGMPQRTLHIHYTPRGQEHVDVETTPIRDRAGKIIFFVETMRTLQHARSQPSAQGLVGKSPAFNRMLALVGRVAPSDATVLLLGESGTGKELVAQALHEASGRAQGPFVAVDCAGMTETLFGSELFGYEKGSFTGAVGRKTGLVEAAAGGTLFFDEVGDIPLCLQVKLLRLLESGTFRRVGGVEPLRADFRLVLATHRDLKAMVEAGSFRRDLYYRISAFPIHLPPLRERMEDIPLLAESLLARVSPRRRMKLHPDALAALSGYRFSGNIRELRNILEHASLMADGETILPAHLQNDIFAQQPAPSASVENKSGIVPLEEAEQRYLQWVLENHGGDRSSLAHKLGISERTLYRKLKAAALIPGI